MRDDAGFGETSFGPIVVDALETFRDVFLAEEPLVAHTDIDEEPRRLLIALDDGVGSPGRFTVRWSVRDRYGVHYSEKDVDWRFGRHTNPHGLAAHFHPPPDARANPVEESCIRHRAPEPVARAAHRCWRRWHESGGDVGPNAVDDPP